MRPAQKNGSGSTCKWGRSGYLLISGTDTHFLCGACVLVKKVP